jgi:hypothetical protein
VLPGCPKSYTEVTGYLCVFTKLGTLQQDTEIADNTGCLGILFLAVVFLAGVIQYAGNIIWWEE